MTRGRDDFMLRAIALAKQGVDVPAGGPFGCVVVRNDEIIGEGFNKVTAWNDPTAHAEVVAIRDACARIGSFQLDGCEIYTSCEPCPMCLGAIYWSRAKQIYIACDRNDAAAAGFDDAFIYDELAVSDLSARKIPITGLLRDEGLKVFDAWLAKEDKVSY